MALGILFGIMLGAMALGFPIALAMAVAVLGYVFFVGNIPLTVIFQRMVSGANSFPMVAIPLFIFAGSVMNAGGMTTRIFRFARAVIGFIPGGLAHVNIVASAIFAGMSGSAVADVCGLGLIEVKAMREAGFDDSFSAAVTAAASTLSPIIPPSIAAVIYAVMTDTSVGDMFLAGVLPGFTMAFFMMVTVYFIARKRKFPRDKRSSAGEIWRSFEGAILAILTPGIILAGIYGGFFTPTEAAVVADIYALVVCGLIYKELKLKDLPGILLSTVESSALIMFIICVASSFSWVIIRGNYPRLIGDFLASLNLGQTNMLLLFVLIYLLLGCFLESIAIMMITIPIFFPVVLKMGIHPVHFGIIMLVDLMIGLLTPPVGICLYAVSNVANTPIEKVIRELIPFFIALTVCLLLLVYFPQISLWLPALARGR